jgi:biotin operon repressor
MTTLSELDRQILDHIRHTFGFVKSYQLEQLLGISGKEVRRSINTLRRLSYGVCSSQKGYYYSTNEHDIENTIHNLSCRVVGINAAMEGLAKIGGGCRV